MKHEATADHTSLPVRESKVKRPKSKKPKPSGFEEYYNDAPLTVEEHEQEKSLYDPRIETAIQRYASKRRLSNERRHLLDKYLSYGGVETGPRMFQGGLDADAIAENDAAQIATLTASHALDTSKNLDTDYVVDFELVLQGFLSTSIHNDFDMSEPKVIESHLDTILNFLNYLLYHNVCPEYADQIDRARSMCRLGRQELCLVAQLLPILPGRLNKACSKLCGGFYKAQSNADLDWLDDAQKETLDLETTNQEDLRLLNAGLQAFAQDKNKSLPILTSSCEPPKLVQESQQSIEVVTVTQSIAAALGKLAVKAWHNPSAEEEDVSEDGQDEQEAEILEFWLEDDLLQYMFPGMKLELGVKTLACGYRYFDAVYAVNCSFYVYLPNEMMVGWRKLEDEWLPPPPAPAAKEDEIVVVPEGTDPHDFVKQRDQAVE